jgi:hypothetical protein
MPSLSSSPWMRRAPHNGLALLMRRIKSRISVPCRIEFSGGPRSPLRPGGTFCAPRQAGLLPVIQFLRTRRNHFPNSLLVSLSCRATLKGLEGRRNIRRLPNFQGDSLDAERVHRVVDLGQLPHGRRIVGIGHDSQSAKAGDDLAQELEALARKFGRRDRQPVTLPPYRRSLRRLDRGRSRTRSAQCGSPTATAPAALPLAMMTSGASAANSAACLRRSSTLPPPKR